MDPATGGWGKVILDPINSTQTTTLANLDTLGSLITAFATVADDNWRARFLKAATSTDGATPKNTLEAMAGIAREPWADPKDLYTLFDEAYPQPKDGSRRAAPFVPYLAYTPPDFALISRAAGCTPPPGSCSMWMATSGAGRTGCPARSPALATTSVAAWSSSPPTGPRYRRRVWASSFNGKILVMDFDGHPIGKESDIPFKEKFLGLMGIGVAANGDVWIADGSDNQLLYFPGGRVKDGRIVKVEELKSPFNIVIDAQNRVWVSNSQSDMVVRFPADDPSKVESFRPGSAETHRRDQHDPPRRHLTLGAGLHRRRGDRYTVGLEHRRQ